MRLNSVEPGRVISNDVGENIEFKIAANAKAFSVLIDTIYANKIKAPIREISTNAYEAHQIANIESKPFLVTLPSVASPFFKVRDYGPGLSQQDVKQVYTTIFESTKDQRNDLGGAFGLGSKSPYAYTDNFIVTSVHGGLKTVYSMNKSNGKPQATVMSESVTSEETGIEVQLAVKPVDISKFVSEAQQVYKWFKVHPDVVGNASYRRQYINTEKPTVEGTGWRYYSSSNEASTVAVMGNIAYALNGYTGQHPELGTKPGLIVDFKIGDLEPTPARENLSFEARTQLAIENRFNTVINEYSKKIQDSITEQKTFWDAYIKLQELSERAILPVKVTYKGRQVVPIVLTQKVIDPNHVPAAGQNPRYINEPIVRLHSSSSNSYSDGIQLDSIAPNKNIKIVILDKGSYKKIRIKMFREANRGVTTLTLHEEDVKKFKDLTEVDDSYFVKLSDLPKPVYAKNTTQRRSKVLKFKMSNHQYDNGYWEDSEVDEETEGYFVKVSSNKIVYGDKEIKPKDLKQVLIALFGSKIPDIYGLKASFKDTEELQLDDLIENIKVNAKAIIKSIENVSSNKLTFDALYRIDMGFVGRLSELNNAEFNNLLYNLPQRIDEIYNNRSDAYGIEILRVLEKLDVDVTINPKVNGDLINEFSRTYKLYPLLSAVEFYGDESIIKKELLVYLNAKKGV